MHLKVFKMHKVWKMFSLYTICQPNSRTMVLGYGKKFANFEPFCYLNIISNQLLDIYVKQKNYTIYATVYF